MKNTLTLFLLFVAFTVTTMAQTPAATPDKPTVAPVVAKKRGPVFRPTKDQLKQVQEMLKGKKLYDGEAIGKYNPETRTAIKSFQKDNGLRQTGTLNRATLEKMGIELTDAQKAIAVSDNSFAKLGDPTAKADDKPKRKIFRANKTQIMEAQKLMKARSLYSGDETGKLDDDTRAGLKKFQEANGIKVTGTLNRATLEKMGIELTDSQKEI